MRQAMTRAEALELELESTRQHHHCELQVRPARTAGAVGEASAGCGCCWRGELRGHGC